jgi:hypothetical protein
VFTEERDVVYNKKIIGHIMGLWVILMAYKGQRSLVRSESFIIS